MSQGRDALIETFIAQAGTDAGAPVELQRQIAYMLPDLIEAAERLPIAMRAVCDLAQEIRNLKKTKGHPTRNLLIGKLAEAMYAQGISADDARSDASEAFNGPTDRRELQRMFPLSKAGKKSKTPRSQG